MRKRAAALEAENQELRQQVAGLESEVAVLLQFKTMQERSMRKYVKGE